MRVSVIQITLAYDTLLTSNSRTETKKKEVFTYMSRKEDESVFGAVH